jgi:DNA-binding transcriptional MocR family regulator
MFDEARQQIVAELRSASTLRVFLSLPDHLTWTTFSTLNQVELAKKLEIDDGSVSRALKELTERGIVERKGRGPVSKWKLSLKWGWRGSAAAYHAAVREAAANQPPKAATTTPPKPRLVEVPKRPKRATAKPAQPAEPVQESLTLLRRVIDTN